MIPGNVPDRRFQVALGLSLLAHILLAGNWSGGVRGSAMPGPLLQARLESPPAMPQGAAFVADAERAVVPDPAKRPRSRVARGAELSPAPDAGAAGTDSRFYPARELDQYPELLELPDSRQALPVAHVRVWVGIDQQGRVVDVVAADPGYPVADIRERLLVIRFAPGRKDGRPVKSRLLVEWPER